MKANTAQLITLNEITNKALLDIGEGAHMKEKFLMWALMYYKKYKMDLAREIKTIQVPLTPWKSIILPDDCVDFIAVGIKNGEVLDTFVNKGRDLTPRDSANDEDAPTAPTYTTLKDPNGEGIVFCNFTQNGEDPGKLFGLLVKDNLHGYFTPNYNQNVNEIQLSANVAAGTPIFLMYLSTLWDPNVSSIVHPYAEGMLHKGIIYEHLKNSRYAGNRRIDAGMVAQAKIELDDEICLLAERRFDLSVDDIIEICRSGYRMGPKI